MSITLKQSEEFQMDKDTEVPTRAPLAPKNKVATSAPVMPVVESEEEDPFDAVTATLLQFKKLAFERLSSGAKSQDEMYQSKPTPASRAVEAQLALVDAGRRAKK